MKRLRHPVRAIREPFGTAGLVVACIALLAALGGTALAAAKLNSTQKKEVEKIAKRFAGKPGTAGPQGSAGAKGDTGATGATGNAGTNGTNGTNGTSAEATSFAGSKTVGSVTCKEGGVEVKSAKPATAVCNGSPWTAGGTLPKGQTAMGVWATPVIPFSEGPGLQAVPISFPLPLASAPAAEVIEEGAPSTTACPGTAAEPKATEGNLCIYVAHKSAVNAVTINSAIEPADAKAGGLIVVNLEQFGQANGSWAVTAGS